MPIMRQKFQIRAYFDFGNGEKFSKTVGCYNNNYPSEEQVLKDILHLKEMYQVCKFEYAQVEKIYVLD